MAKAVAPPKPRNNAQKQSSGFRRFLTRLVEFDIAKVFSRAHVPGPPRTVFVNEPLPEDYKDPKGRIKKDHVFITNQVITSKYTVITFLPRNLLEQFRRVANIFFATIAILQFFSIFSTVSPGLAILPLIIVLLITAIKDGYEDIKRHQSDKRVNLSQIRVLSGGAWDNPNGAGAKSKTFVRGLVPKGLKRSKKNGESPADVEMQARGAPPGAIDAVAGERVGSPSADEPGHDHDERSFDDDVEEQHGRFHIGGSDMDDHPHWRKTSWEDVRVGDLVKIMSDESIPADVLICATSEEENVAYVETKNLDGETNLKSRNAVPALTHMRTAAACVDPANAFHIELDRPDVNMYKLDGAVVHKGEKSSVELQSTLLRGTVLRNTEWVIGIVLFTGEDTKIVLNSGGTPSKRSRVERQMNPQVFINLAILAVMAVVCGVADSSLQKYYFPRNALWLYGDNQSDNNPQINGLITWAFALITFQNIVPVSLYISIEGVRTVQAAFIYFDYQMWYKKTDQPALARSWNLSDDLGQIEYIFSDKTGTLTQNSMVFRECSIGGRAYHGDADMAGNGDDSMDSKEDLAAAKLVHSNSSGTSGEAPTDSTRVVPDPLQADTVKLSAGVLQHFRDAKLSADMDAAVQGNEDATWARSLNGFFTVLALCHTVITAVDPETGALEYKAQSPDEAALVQAAADVGFVFRGREREILRLQTPFADELREYELLDILEFTSARKRMSVVVRSLSDEDRRLFLLTKGADNVIFERLKEGEDELKSITTKHLDDFANDGLRTLTLAYKVIPEDYYADWSHRYHEASTTLDDREGKIEAVSEEMERDLRMLGATAIEDRLQDGVPETIADLKRAGIKIWVATGDKLETAIAIGHSTNLIQKDSNIIVIRGNAENGRPVYAQMVRAVAEFFPESDILEDDAIDTSALEGQRTHAPRVNSGMSEVVGENNGERPGGFVLVVDGAALEQGLGDEEHKYLLLRLATQCEGVICCRVSPKQKAEVTRMVREGLGVMTLAIGDGANDVSMIQAADVGVGISGEEGLQAVNSSDYAIAQFRYLKRLLLVHGHWSYARNGLMITNFFYKNMVCIGALFWFQIYCGWSSAYVFDYTYILFWNSFWTIAPVIAMGLFDRIVDDDVLMAIPELYAYGRNGHWFGIRMFLLYMTEAIFQSAVIYFFTMYSYETISTRMDGFSPSIYEFSTPMFFAAVFAADLFVGFNTLIWTWWVFFAVAIGIVLVWIFGAVYQAISPGWTSTTVYGNNAFLYPSAIFWFSMLLAVIVALAPRYIFRAIQTTYYPTDLDILRYNRKYRPEIDVTAGAYTGNRLAELKRSASRTSRTSRASRVSASGTQGRPSMDPRMASRTDMASGMRSVHRGFDFITEEPGGVAMRRIQTNLSERRTSQLNLSRPRRSTTLLRTLRLSMSRKKRPTGHADLDHDDER